MNLHFDPPRLYSCHTWSPLIRALIRFPPAGCLDIARFIELLCICSPFKLGYWRTSNHGTFVWYIRPLLYLSVHFERLCPDPFNWFPFYAYYAETPYVCLSMPLDRNFLITGGGTITNKALYLHSEVHNRSKTWTQVSSMVEFINHISNSIFRQKSIWRVFPNPVTYV